MNIALQQTIQERDKQTEKLSKQIEALTIAMGGSKVDFGQNQEEWKQPDSPSPSVMMDPTDLNPPTFFISPPEEESDKRRGFSDIPVSPSRSSSPFSARKPLDKTLSNDT
jgi:hypothetical protein